MNVRLHPSYFDEHKNPICSRAYQPPGESWWVRLLALVAVPLIVLALGIQFCARLVFGRDEEER